MHRLAMITILLGSSALIASPAARVGAVARLRALCRRQRRGPGRVPRSRPDLHRSHPGPALFSAGFQPTRSASRSRCRSTAETSSMPDTRPRSPPGNGSCGPARPSTFPAGRSRETSPAASSSRKRASPTRMAGRRVQRRRHRGGVLPRERSRLRSLSRSRSAGCRRSRPGRRDSAPGGARREAAEDQVAGSGAAVHGSPQAQSEEHKAARPVGGSGRARPLQRREGLLRRHRNRRAHVFPRRVDRLRRGRKARRSHRPAV